MPFKWIIRGLLLDHTRGIGTLLTAPTNRFVRWVKRVGLWAVADGAPHGFELNFVSPPEKCRLPSSWVEQTLLVWDEEVIKRYSQFCWALSILDQVYSLKQKRKTLVKKLTKSLASQRSHCTNSTITKHRLSSPFDAGAQWFQFHPKFCNLIQILQPWANQKLTWHSHEYHFHAVNFHMFGNKNRQSYNMTSYYMFEVIALPHSSKTVKPLRWPSC
mgnify:CR=1 FL=1